jgi:lipoprotein
MKKLLHSLFVLLAFCACDNDTPSPVPDKQKTEQTASEKQDMQPNPNSPVVLLGNRERLTLKEIIAERRVPVSKEDFEKYALGYGWRRKVNPEQHDYGNVCVTADGRVVYRGKNPRIGASNHYSFYLKNEMMRAFTSGMLADGRPVYYYSDYAVSSYDASRNALLLDSGSLVKKELWKIIILRLTANTMETLSPRGSVIHDQKTGQSLLVYEWQTLERMPEEALQENLKEFSVDGGFYMEGGTSWGE